MSLTDRLVQRERAVVILSVALLAALAWGWTLGGAWIPDAPSGPMTSMMPVSIPAVALLLLMWWVMMVAMMLPSAAPTILLYGRIRQQRGEGSAIGPLWVFLTGYLVTWLAFSILASAVHLLAISAGLLDAMTMRATSRPLAGGALVAAGLYQLSPIKNLCLVNCRTPAAFLMRHWRPGAVGSLRLGLLHGSYCVGCCWLLMILLFVGGVMNFLWIAALATLVAAEKLLPRAALIAQAAGVALILWGLAAMLIR